MFVNLAPDQNRTDTRSLEGYCSTIELQAQRVNDYARNGYLMQLCFFSFVKKVRDGGKPIPKEHLHYKEDIHEISLDPHQKLEAENICPPPTWVVYP